jgi:GNAT superfamily N-acetyltransferase
MMNIHHDLLEGSPALAPFMRNYAELIANGWARPFTPHNNKHKVVYATDPNGTVMGGIVYAIMQETFTGWIVFSFTEPEFRKQGVYTALHAELERRLRASNVTDLASHVHVDNKVRQISCEKVGMVPEFYRMHKKL